MRVILLDLGFFEFDVLLRDRIIFAEHHLLGDVARVFLGHVIKARALGRDELDLDGCGLRHGGFLQIEWGAPSAGQT